MLISCRIFQPIPDTLIPLLPHVHLSPHPSVQEDQFIPSGRQTTALPTSPPRVEASGLLPPTQVAVWRTHTRTDTHWPRKEQLPSDFINRSEAARGACINEQIPLNSSTATWSAGNEFSNSKENSIQSREREQSGDAVRVEQTTTEEEGKASESKPDVENMNQKSSLT